MVIQGFIQPFVGVLTMVATMTCGCFDHPRVPKPWLGLVSRRFLGCFTLQGASISTKNPTLQGQVKLYAACRAFHKSGCLIDEGQGT